MKRTYDYNKMNEMAEILKALELPKNLTNVRGILTLLATAQIEEKSKWRSAQESYMRTHDMIHFINMHYPNKGGTDLKKGDYKENTRESIRKGAVAPFCEIAILESNGEVTNSGNTGYRLTKEFAKLLKSYGTEEWHDNLEYYKSSHISYAQKYNQDKDLDKGLGATFNGVEYRFSVAPHNRLQIAVLNDFVPYFVSGAKLLYIGDTKNRIIVKDDEMLKKLNVHVLDNAKLPDIILYDENEKHKWLLFIEAYTSSGEITIERKKKILEYCQDCPKDVEIIFVTAFMNMKKCKEKFLSIAWDTEIWVAEEPKHMIHKNGDRFIAGHESLEE